MSRAQLTSTVEQNTGGAVAPFVAGKNAIINGGMDIWQRSTSIALAASASITYLADRWCATTGASQATTVSRQATGDTTNLPNIQYGFRYQRNSGQTGTSIYTLISAFETINSIPFVGKTVTLSFYARAGANFSATSNLLGASVISSTGTDQNPFSVWAGSATPVSGSATLTTTWQRFSYTGTIASTATQLAVDFQWNPTGTAGANDYFDITGVQLELGSTATTFSRAGGSIGGELALCQRYYWRNTESSGTNGAVASIGFAYSTTATLHYIQFPVPMRVTPTSWDFSNLEFRNTTLSTFAVSAIAMTDGGVNGGRLITTVATTTSGTVGILETSATNGYLGASAEL